MGVLILSQRDVEALLDMDCRGMWISTFHALCARLLRREAPHIGLSRDFTIYDSADQQSVIKQLVKEYGLERVEGLLLRYLSDVYKTLVYRLARYRNTLSPVIPPRVIERPVMLVDVVPTALAYLGLAGAPPEWVPLERLDEEANWSMQLSGGEQQRVAFARALLHEPKWLFLDEATSALDDEAQGELHRLLHQRLTATTIVSIAHRPAVAEYHDHTVQLVRDAAGPSRLREQVP